jgi:hypothetical protein
MAADAQRSEADKTQRENKGTVRIAVSLDTLFGKRARESSQSPIAINIARLKNLRLLRLDHTAMLFVEDIAHLQSGFSCASKHGS